MSRLATIDTTMIDHRTTEERIGSWLGEMSADPRLVHVHRVPPREARFDTLAVPLPERIACMIPTGGLWSHQAHAIDAVRAGRSVVVATGTASGKSLCYQIPIAESVTRPVRPGTALVLFPTKALAHDQLRGFGSFGLPQLIAAPYDGDATPEMRKWARTTGRVILTNPEMLHHGILPNHRKWSTFLGRLTHIVVDEAHSLRGVFGSHTAHVLRRTVRLAQHYGADPVFVFTSATVGAPEELASELSNRKVEAITDDGSPSGERVVALWQPNPDPSDPTSPFRSTIGEAGRIAASLVDDGLATLVFCESRRATETLAGTLRDRITGGHDRVRAYRSGYLPTERRQIEAELSSGTVDCVVATSALELGIDIGGLDATVLCGIPGTVASLWQRVGRSGRRGGPSLAVVVAGDDQLDQWILAHPAEALARAPERAVVNVANPMVVDAHVACAAHERPLSHRDEEHWPDLLDDAVLRGVRSEDLRLLRRGPDLVAVYDGGRWPSSLVGLRAAGGEPFRIVDRSGTLIGTVDAARVCQQSHPGAVYLHQGRPWLVTQLDLVDRRVVVESNDGETTTQARTRASTVVLEEHDVTRVGRAGLSLGLVEVTRQVVGYQIRRVADRTVIGEEPLDLPPTTTITTSVWYTFDQGLIRSSGLEERQLPGALHAVEHAAIGMLPLFTICDRWDVGGLSTASAEDTGLPTVFVHDAVSGGAGIAPLAFHASPRHLAATLDLIRACRCATGCPACIQSPKCGNGNEPLDKAGAILLLAGTLA